MRRVSSARRSSTASTHVCVGCRCAVLRPPLWPEQPVCGYRMVHAMPCTCTTTTPCGACDRRAHAGDAPTPHHAWGVLPETIHSECPEVPLAPHPPPRPRSPSTSERMRSRGPVGRCRCIGDAPGVLPPPRPYRSAPGTDEQRARPASHRLPLQSDGAHPVQNTFSGAHSLRRAWDDPAGGNC